MLICQKLDYAGYPSFFMNNVIGDYEHKQNKSQNQEDEFIMPPNLFEIAKELIFVKFLYCSHNECVAKEFLTKFHQFRNQVAILRIIKKVKSLFFKKDKSPYPVCCAKY